MTDTPTPPAMTPKQRAELVDWLMIPCAETSDTDAANMEAAADQLEADGLALAAAQAEIARLSRINVKLCADFNLMNQHGAKQDTEITRLQMALAETEALEMQHGAAIARLTAALATARELREAVQIMRMHPAGVLTRVHVACNEFDAAIAKGATP